MYVYAFLFTFVVAGVPLGVGFALVALGNRYGSEGARKGRRPGLLLTFLIAIAAGVVVWLSWLTWDSYYLDEQGIQHGPYSPWQVVACGATMVVVTVALGLFSRWPYSGPFAVALGATFGFSMAWGVDALSQDVTGLAGAGLLFLIIGASTGLLVVAAVTAGATAIYNSTKPRFKRHS